MIGKQTPTGQIPIRELAPRDDFETLLFTRADECGDKKGDTGPEELDRYLESPGGQEVAFVNRDQVAAAKSYLAVMSKSPVVDMAPLVGAVASAIDGIEIQRTTPNAYLLKGVIDARYWRDQTKDFVHFGQAVGELLSKLASTLEEGATKVALKNASQDLAGLDWERSLWGGNLGSAQKHHETLTGVRDRMSDVARQLNAQIPGMCSENVRLALVGNGLANVLRASVKAPGYGGAQYWSLRSRIAKRLAGRVADLAETFSANVGGGATARTLGVVAESLRAPKLRCLKDGGDTDLFIAEHRRIEQAIIAQANDLERLQ